VNKLIDYTFTPHLVTSFVGDPAWTVAATFTNPNQFSLDMTDMTYTSTGSVGRPGLISAPNFSVPGHGSANLDSSPPTFDCKALGDGSYAVTLTVSAFAGGLVGIGTHLINGVASCVERPVFTADLQPPSTIFTVTFPKNPPNEAITYSWQGAIGCGTFAPFSKKPADFRIGDQQAIWTHPNAPDPSLAQQDKDGDGLPDFCPHNEDPTTSTSHPGTVSVQLAFGGRIKILCTYSGSLSGTGECHGVW
jgi:hypothetical protein